MIEDTTNHPNLIKVIELLESQVGDIELVSYGLAPRPNGFCYEVHNTYNEISNACLIDLDNTLESLTNEEELTLKELYL